MKAGFLLSVYVLVFSTLGQGASIVLRIGGQGTVALETAPVEVESGEAGQAVFACEDVRWLSDTGEPRIPWKVVTVLLPPNADLSTVTCRLEQPVIESVAGTWQVEPMPPIAARDENGQVIVVWPDDKRIINGRDVDIYERDAFWPDEHARLEGSGRLRKWRLAEIAVPLIRYNPVTGQLLRLANTEIKVDFQAQPKLLHADRPDPIGRSRVRRMAANFAQAVADYDTAAQPGKPGEDSTAAEGISPESEAAPDPTSTGYAIITTSSIQSASDRLNAFVTYKQSQGFDVHVITEATWGGGTGDTAANNIRAWLADNYLTQDILYVLLIGNPHPDDGDVPMKVCISDHPTDYFYAELTADWDKDGDGIYGESGDDATAGDEVEKYFEVYTGRIPFYGNIGDTDAILEKTIDYENEADAHWRRNILLPMVPLDGSTPSYHLGEQIKHNILEPQAIPSDRIYDKTYGVIPPPEYLRSKAYPATVWRQHDYGLVVWMTHGSSQGASGIIGSGDAPNLDDAHPAATYQGSCTNSRPETTNNLGYALLKNGAIATVGATRLSWYYVGQTDFTNTSSIGGIGYQYAQRLVQRQSCGQALYDTKEALSLWPKNYYVMTLYGDPSVVLFGPPPDLTISPTDTFYQVGYYGLPLDPMSRSYTLTNNSLAPRDWTATTNLNWLDVPAAGTIPAQDSVTIDVVSTAQWFDWRVGEYSGGLTFVDVTGGAEHPRQATLVIRPRVLMGHWKLDETAGTTAHDASGNDYHGTLEGEFSFDTHSADGQFGGALDFGDINDCVNTGRTPADLGLCGNVPRTVTAWVYTRSFNDGGIFEMGRHSTGCDFSLRTESNWSQWRVQYWGSSDIDFTYDAANKWVHFAHVHDGSRTRIYANGVVVVNEPRILSTGDTKTFTVGRWQDSYFDGLIDDVRIYSYALDIDAIRTVMGGGRAEAPSPFDSAIDVPQRAILNWAAGATAQAHDVYLGTSHDAVLNATNVSPQYKGRQTEASYVPFLDTNTPYFWRIDEVVPGPRPGSTKTVPGKTWNFVTGPTAGTLTREVYTGITGNAVADLTNHSLYPDFPAIRDEIPSFETPTDYMDNYGTRVHGFLLPAESGNYTFWIAGDDNCELWLSTDSNPSNQRKIAEVPGYTDPRQWDRYTQQRSALISLNAGQPYYVKALHKEGTGGDNLAVAWQGPGISQQVIAGRHLAPYDTELPIPDPVTWHDPPHPTSCTSVSMTADPALDRSGVQYYFACTSGHDSGWQNNPTYQDSNLEPNTAYVYTVIARDKNPNQNTTGPSQPYPVRTFLAADLEPDSDVDFADLAALAPSWRQSNCGDCAGADLTGDGNVDSADLAKLASDWLAVVHQPPPLPGPATNPYPPNGATDVSLTADLTWATGLGAESHDVYFGTADPPAFIQNQVSTTFDPGNMAGVTTYFWQIHERNAGGAAPGSTWSFTTQPKVRACLAADTLVWIEGKLLLISAVTPGQKVGRQHGPLRAGSPQIESIDEHAGMFDCYDIVLEAGSRITVADSHLFLSDTGKWLRVQNLRPGCKLQSLTGSIIVKNIVRRQTPYIGKVYNLRVRNSDRYFVGADAVIARDY